MLYYDPKDNYPGFPGLPPILIALVRKHGSITSPGPHGPVTSLHLLLLA